jgi:hypothetical protein
MRYRFADSKRPRIKRWVGKKLNENLLNWAWRNWFGPFNVFQLTSLTMRGRNRAVSYQSGKLIISTNVVAAEAMLAPSAPWANVG